MTGDVFLVRSATMDQALWKVGGAAVALRLVQAATVSEHVPLEGAFERLLISFELCSHPMDCQEVLEF